MAATPAERSLAARIANEVRWSQEPDRKTATAPARKGLETKWAAEVDPEGKLPPDELERRIGSCRKAHMLRMTLASMRARRGARERA